MLSFPHCPGCAAFYHLPGADNTDPYLYPSDDVFVIAFNTYPQIKKFLIDPYMAEHPQNENDTQETVFSDELLIESAPKQKEVKE